MILRFMVFALMAIGLVGTVAWISTRPPPPPPQAAAPPPPATIAMLAAAHPLCAGSLLKPEDLTGKEILASDRSADER